MAVLAAAGCAGAPATDAAAESSAPTAPEKAVVGRFTDVDDLAAALRDAARDAGGARSDVEARSGAGSVRGSLLYDYRTDDVRVSGELEVSAAISMDLGLVLADSTLYLQVPSVYRLLSGAAWVRVPAGSERAAVDDARAPGQVDALLETLISGVPGQALLDLENAHDVELVALGTQTLDGRALEGYSVEAIVDGSQVTLVHWIDEHDLLYRLDQTVDDPATLDPATSTRTFDDWGVAAAVAPPDGSQVIDLPDGLL